jgi:hypothetical protein
MVWAHRFWLRLQTLFRRDRITQRLDDEIQFHLDQQIAENISAGMSPDEARYAAQRTAPVGGPSRVADDLRLDPTLTRSGQRFGKRWFRTIDLCSVPSEESVTRIHMSRKHETEAR